MYPLPPKSFQVSFEQPRPQPHTLSSSRTYYLPNPHKYLRPYNVPQHQIPPATLLPKSSLAPHSAPTVRNSSSHAILRPTSASIRLPPHSPVLSSPIKSINHLQITTFNPGQHDQYDKIVTTSPTLRQSVQRGHSTVTHKMQHNQSSNHSQQHLLNNSHQHSLNNSQQYSSRMAS